jgi:Dyp-type peroxidase family
MTVDLTQPLAWKSATDDASTMLDELQANILKAHVRDRLSVLLLRFSDATEGRTFLRLVARDLMKSARAHLDETEEYKASGERTSGAPYVGVGLSYEGYAALDVARRHRPADGSFARGMRSRATRGDLGDPPIAAWDPPYRKPIHAVVLVGDKTQARRDQQRAAVDALRPGSVTVVGEETGIALHDDDDRGIEHFGYVDGRSQPLFLVEDVEAERMTTDGTNVWDPGFPLAQILVSDPAAPDPSTHFGSYLILRKLEQNVALFDEQEDHLADQLGLVETEDRERAGAMLVGRFEDGTPLTLQTDGGAHNPVMNDFSYASDPQGMKCPLYAHIRKMNSRAVDGRRHLMARRGQTYGVRDRKKEQAKKTPVPVGDVGLLFMAFNADIAEQFEYTQKNFANLADPTQGPTSGVDPVIGQATREETASPTSWGGSEVMTTDAIAQAVTMKGGEYFFAPSLAFLRSL